MRHPDLSEKVTALQYTQKAIEAMEGVILTEPETRDAVTKLREVRKELAYEIYRAEHRIMKHEVLGGSNNEK